MTYKEAYEEIKEIIDDYYSEYMKYINSSCNMEQYLTMIKEVVDKKEKRRKL